MTVPSSKPRLMGLAADFGIGEIEEVSDCGCLSQFQSTRCCSLPFSQFPRTWWQILAELPPAVD